MIEHRLHKLIVGAEAGAGIAALLELRLPGIKCDILPIPSTIYPKGMVDITFVTDRPSWEVEEAIDVLRPVYLSPRNK